MKRVSAVGVVLAACHATPLPPPPTPPPRADATPAHVESATDRRFAEIVAGAPTPTAAYFAAFHQLGDDPAAHGKLAMLAERAADAEIDHARGAKGPGGAWLHAALAARIAGGKPPRRAAGDLDAVTMPDFDYVPPPASCAWVGGPKRPGAGRLVEVVTSNLACQLAADRSHARISGSIVLRWEGGETIDPVMIDLAGTSSGPSAVIQLHEQLDHLVRRAWAAPQQARLAATDPADAEDALILLARLGEVDAARLAHHMEQFGITFAELDLR